MKEKVVIIGGKGTAVVIAEQIYDAQTRFGRDIEVLGFAFDDPAYSAGINGWPVLCGTREAYAKYKDDESVKFVLRCTVRIFWKNGLPCVRVSEFRWIVFCLLYILQLILLKVHA